MAKNDYHVIMYRILIYLYACLKEGVPFDPDEVSYERLGIPESYWSTVVAKMAEKGFITGAVIIPLLGIGKRIKWVEPEITPEGVEFLQENSLMGKAREFLKTVKETIPGL